MSQPLGLSAYHDLDLSWPPRGQVDVAKAESHPRVLLPLVTGQTPDTSWQEACPCSLDPILGLAAVTQGTGIGCSGPFALGGGSVASSLASGHAGTLQVLL